MRRIDTLNKATDLFGSGKHGWKNGIAGTGDRPTEGKAEWFNSVQEELSGTIEFAGEVLVPNQSDQLRKAIQKLAGQLNENAAFVITGDGVNDVSAQVIAANAAGRPVRFVGIAHVTVAVTLTVPIVDTQAQIFTATAQITIGNGMPVRPEWWGGGENTVHLAGLSLPTSGGVVLLGPKTYQRNNHVYNGKYWGKDNVTFRGTKMPEPTNDCKSLTNGTVIQGTWLMFANNCEMTDVMIDSGFTYTQGINGGVASDGLLITYPSAAAKAANASVRGIRVRIVGGLCNGPSDAVHAVILAEGTYDTVASGDVLGIFGVHGVVIKGASVRAETLRAYSNSGNGVIIKTDQQTTAIASDVQIGKIVVRASGPEGWAPYAVPSLPASSGSAGLRFHCFGGDVTGVQIGKYFNDGYDLGIDTQITAAAGYTLDMIQIGRVLTRNNAVTGMNILAPSGGGAIQRFQIGEAINRDSPTGAVFVWTSPSTVKVGSLHAVNCSNAAVAVSSSADPTVDVVTADNSAAAFQITTSGKPRIGKTILLNGTSLYYQSSGSGQVPALSNSWSQVGGGDSFNVIPTHYGIEINGMLSSGSSNVIMTLPQFARPPSEKRFLLQGRSGSTQAAIPVVITTAGVVTINDASGSIANVSSYVSLAGISYSITN